MIEIEFTVLNSKGGTSIDLSPLGESYILFPSLVFSEKNFFEKKLGAELNQPPISVSFINLSELHCC